VPMGSGQNTSWLGLGGSFLSGLVLVSQAAGTEVKAPYLPVYGNGSRMNIGQPTTVGTVLRVADIVPELR
jgi:hypothetical protein